MTGKYYFLYINMNEGKIPNEQIEQSLSDSDWARLRGGGLYLVYSKRSAHEIRTAIQPMLSDKDHLFVGEFNWNHHSGWLSMNTVNWLNKSRE